MWSVFRHKMHFTFLEKRSNDKNMKINYNNANDRGNNVITVTHCYFTACF